MARIGKPRGRRNNKTLEKLVAAEPNNSRQSEQINHTTSPDALGNAQIQVPVAPQAVYTDGLAESNPPLHTPLYPDIVTVSSIHISGGRRVTNTISLRITA